jgi:hypothetical protein
LKNYPESLIDFTVRSGRNFVSSLSFLTGFAVLLVATGDFFKFSAVNIYSSAASTLSPFWSNFVLTVAAPIAEEYFFLIGSFYVMEALLNLFAREFQALAVFKNVWARIITSTVTIAAIFAIYHTSQAVFTNFIIAAMVFRGVLLVIAATDARFNSIPYIHATFLFALGAHMANNINATVGLGKWFALMASDPLGWFVIAFFALNVFGIAEPLLHGRSVKSLVAPRGQAYG